MKVGVWKGLIDIETLEQLRFARMYTLGRLGMSNVEAWDNQPNGFNNTIRWNVGHIYVTLETLIQKAVGDYEPVNSEWIPLFAMGSSPSGWEGVVPSNDELLAALQEQIGRICKVLEGRLNERLVTPKSIGNMLTMETVEAIVLFAGWHEGLHAGIIHALNGVVKG